MRFFKKATFYIFLFFTLSGISQQRIKAKFGELTYNEKQMTSYEKDLKANAVVLFESGEYSVRVIGRSIKLVKEIHRKIKVFNAKEFKQSIVEIPLYKNSSKEYVTKLEAITHNGESKTFVAKDAIFTVDQSEYWYAKRFTFPNIKDGSILEYTYRIESPFFFNFGEWAFQDDLPKIYTEFYAEIPANFKYNRALYGKEKLYINDAYIKDNCFSIEGSSSIADCEVLTYAMKDIPAFKKEEYMLAARNFISRISFELQEYTNFQGFKEEYSKTWKDVDREFRYEKDIGKQLKYKSYFKDNIPANILLINDPLEKSKAVYTFIQNHYSWNGKYDIFSDNRVKDAFEEKTGSVPEINISLINALNAADLDAKLVLSPTRGFGLPTLRYPVLTEFNYVAALLTIGDTKYILDATDKFASFDVLPFRVLNIQGRVMDFKKGSYWHPINPNMRNVHYVSAQLLAEEDGTFSGKVSELYSGHIAFDKRKSIANATLEGYRSIKKSETANAEIENLNVEVLHDATKPLKEVYEIVLDSELVGSNTYFYPLVMTPYFEENPFTAETRKYPLDFGFPITNTYMVSIDLNDQYEVIDLPKSRIYKLPDNGGECSVIYSEDNGKVNWRLTVKLKRYRFQPEEYEYLKEFFTNVITMQGKEPIALKRL